MRLRFWRRKPELEESGWVKAAHAVNAVITIASCIAMIWMLYTSFDD